jgi:hypothetical protein
LYVTNHDAVSQDGGTRQPFSQSPSSRVGLLFLVLCYFLRLNYPIFLGSDLKTLSPSLRLKPSRTKPKRTYVHLVKAGRICGKRWPRDLIHELSSRAQTMGWWFRISLQTSMSVCVYPVFVQFCVQITALWLADPPSKVS